MAFDSIPAGKKQVRDESGKWSLVDLDPKDQTDAVILLEEARVHISKMEATIKDLEKEILIISAASEKKYGKK